MNTCTLPLIRDYIHTSILILMLFLGTHMLSAAVIYVDISAAGANNGTSWVNAYTDLQDALATATSGDEIWIAQGVYKPSVQYDLDGNGPDPREVTFKLPNGVMLYGGFAGGELSRNERDWKAHETVLSGDIDNNDLDFDANGIAENTVPDHIGNNAYHVVLTEGVNAHTGLDGLIITAGRAENGTLMRNNPHLLGGGWHDIAGGTGHVSSPTLTHCRFIGNYANYGGAMSMGSGAVGTYQPTIRHCEFIRNEAFLRGGALLLVLDSARVDSSIFYLNRVTVFEPDSMPSRPGEGGAVKMLNSNAHFHHCMFIANSATGSSQDALEGGGGGAVHIGISEGITERLGLVAHAEFLSCGFFENSVSGYKRALGGAMLTVCRSATMKLDLTGCVFSGNHVLPNSGFASRADGGALYNINTTYGAELSSFTLPPIANINITNSTFYNNMAVDGYGGAIYNNGEILDMTHILDVNIENTLLYENNAMSGPEILNSVVGVITGEITTVSYSLIGGSGGSGGGWDLDLGTDGGNNLDTNPKFVNAANPWGGDGVLGTPDDGLRLLGPNSALTSAAVDGGNNTASGIVGVAKDFAGNNRTRGIRIDIGAYETFNIPKAWYCEIFDWNVEFGPDCPFCSPTWTMQLDPYSYGESKSQPGTRFQWVKAAELEDHGEYAIVEGMIQDIENPSAQFEVYLKLENKQTWEEWSSERRTYLAKTKEAASVAEEYHTHWSFWELSPESILKGRGEIEGVLRLKPSSYHTGFQLGIGGNAMDGDLGLGGEFKYGGRVQIEGKEAYISGRGSIHMDLKEGGE